MYAGRCLAIAGEYLNRHTVRTPIYFCAAVEMLRADRCGMEMPDEKVHFKLSNGELQ
jgi:hypothetical protein